MKMAFYFGCCLVWLASCAPVNSSHSSADPSDSHAWYRDISSGDGYSFDGIVESLGSPRILALGESSHGLGEFFRLKSDFVEYLHQEHGYTVLAMESGLADTGLSWQLADGWTGEQLRDSSVFGNFRAKEVKDLFHYIQAQRSSDRPLHYAGFDSQTSTDVFYNRLDQTIRPHDAALADSLGTLYENYMTWFQCCRSQDSAGYTRLKLRYQQLAREATRVLNNLHRGGDIEKESFQLMERTLNGFDRTVDVPFDNCWFTMQRRDEIMFDNLCWLMDEVYPNQKVIVWAHNAHVESSGLEGLTFTWMGHLLKERFGDDYASIGLFCQKGETFQHWTQQIVPFECTDSLSIEARLQQQCAGPCYIPLKGLEKSDETAWLRSPVTALEMENNGLVTFIPAKRFDGIIHLPESGPPSFE